VFDRVFLPDQFIMRFPPFFLIISLTLGLVAACSDDKSKSTAVASDTDSLLNQGKQKSRMCMSCHGPNGISRVVSYPSLAGQPESYIAGQLEAFRSGVRENPMMSSIAKSLADDDIAALARYYSSLPGGGPTVTDQ
jgi:cytochrome c553